MTEEILRKLLQRVVKIQNFVDYDLKIEPISSGGANFTSNLFNVTITEGDRVVYMFGKVAASSEKIRSQGPKFYETENYVYSKLLKIYEQLEVDHEVPEVHRLIFPKCYGYSSDTFEESIVFEHLIKNGYQDYDRFKVFDWEYAKSAVCSLAKMHALSLAYGEYHPEEFQKTLVHLKYEWMKNDEITNYLKSVVTRSINMTREENRDKFRRFFESFDIDTLPEFHKWSRKPVFGHGDFRPSNLMHRIREDGTVDTKIVDLQTVQGDSPIVDLLSFIYTGSDEEFRTKYYEQLVDHYYSELHAAMTRLHLKPEDIYSRDDFYYELEQKLAFGLILAVFTLPMVTVNAEDAPKVNQELAFTAFPINKNNDLYTERLNGVVNDYVKFGVLK